MKNILIKTNRKKYFFLMIKIAVISTLGFLSLNIVSCKSHIETVHIVKVIDGDTFEDDNKLRYRLLGVDTPESFDSSNNFQSTSGIRKFYATKATNLSLETIINKDVIMKK